MPRHQAKRRRSILGRCRTAGAGAALTSIASWFLLSGASSADSPAARGQGGTALSAYTGGPGSGSAASESDPLHCEPPSAGGSPGLAVRTHFDGMRQGVGAWGPSGHTWSGPFCCGGVALHQPLDMVSATPGATPPARCPKFGVGRAPAPSKAARATPEQTSAGDQDVGRGRCGRGAPAAGRPATCRAPRR